MVIAPQSVHSQNIAASGKVFIVIYSSKAAAGEGKGLYIQATAAALETEPEVNYGLALLGKRRGAPFKYTHKFLGDGPQRIYKATPQHMWLNGATQDRDGDFIRDFRIEVGADT